MGTCRVCGVSVKGNGLKGCCGRCYQMEKKLSSMPTYPLPEKGEVGYAPDGKVICHICGKAFNKVLNHAQQYHGISSVDYKKEFGLDVGKGLISHSTRKKLQIAVEKHYDVVVKQNLVKNGEKTRFLKGSGGRTREKVSLQTFKVMSERFKNIRPNREKNVIKSKEKQKAIY